MCPAPNIRDCVIVHDVDGKGAISTKLMVIISSAVIAAL